MARYRYLVEIARFAQGPVWSGKARTFHDAITGVRQIEWGFEVEEGWGYTVTVDIRTAPTSRITEAGLGKIPTTRARRLISLFAPTVAAACGRAGLPR